MLTKYFENYADQYNLYKAGPFCYEDGCLYNGLIALYRATSEDKWLSHLKRLIDRQVSEDGSLSGYSIDDYNIDNILSGRALLFLHQGLGDQKYLSGASLLAEQLSKHPRTKSGVFWHKKRYPWQIWLDGLYMGQPFQIEFAKLSNNPELIEDSLSQLSIALELLWVPQTRLYAHGYDEAKVQSWANQETGHSSAHWARALGWLCMALVDIHEMTDCGLGEGLTHRLTELLNRVCELQSSSGLWLQVIDQPQLDGNYEESSASAMLSYALMKAARLGIGTQYWKVGRKALAGLEKLVVHGDASGSPAMTQLCEVAGLGGFESRERNGTAEYYISEKVVADDVKGVGPLMMSVAEYKRSKHDYEQIDLLQPADAREEEHG